MFGAAGVQNDCDKAVMSYCFKRCHFFPPTAGIEQCLMGSTRWLYLKNEFNVSEVYRTVNGV